VTKRVPADVVELAPLGHLPPFCMNGRSLAIRVRTTLLDRGPAFGTRTETPSGKAKIVLGIGEAWK
jgi:hypothetical protein